MLPAARIWRRHEEEGLPTARGGKGDMTIFTYDAARLGLDTAGSASGNHARRRGLPTARGGEGGATIYTYNMVLSVMAALLPSPHAVFFLSKSSVQELGGGAANMKLLGRRALIDFGIDLRLGARL
jgi:hypothetical protein